MRPQTFTPLHYIELYRMIWARRRYQHVLVLRMLTDEQKQNCVDVCTDLLCRLQAQPQIFLDRIVTQHETWIHHFGPETKRQSVV